MNFGNITRRTKHYLLMGLLSTLSGVTFAQSYYEFIRYRSNDPFVFCTQGYKEIPAQACWVPVAPYLVNGYIQVFADHLTTTVETGTMRTMMP